MPTATSNSLAIKKGQDALFNRGFKTWCENTAIGIRKKMGLASSSPLSPHDLAEKLNVVIWQLSSVPNLNPEVSNYLSSTEGDEWSAVTVEANSRKIIVTNPTHSPARRASDLMHELAHIILSHDAVKVFITPEGYALRDFNEKQEAEANWFAACLLLPREALTHCLYKRKTTDEAIEEYGVSRQLYTYRQHKTGVLKQYNR